MAGNNAAIASNIAKRYGVLKCEECSIALRNEFRAHGIKGRRVELMAQNMDAERGWIVMRDPAFQFPFPLEAGYPISENCKHFGVEVDGYIYDNIFRSGISAARWIEQFDCRSHRFKLRELEQF